MPEALELEDADPYDRDAYPVKVTLRYLTEEQATPAAINGAAKNGTVQSGLFRSNLYPDDTEDLLNAAKTNPRAGSTEIVRAKYLIGCDGAHSWVRRQLGFVMEGEQTDYIWYSHNSVLTGASILTCHVMTGVFWISSQSRISVSSKITEADFKDIYG